jgi:hypothetical protein
MTTTVTFEPDWHLSSKENMATVVRPIESEAPKPELNVICATFPRARPTAPCAPIRTRGSPIWEWFEFGLVVTLALSGFASIVVFVAGAGNM